MKREKARFTFNGGVHPAYHKQLTADQPIIEMPLPPLLRVSMLQHLGAPAKPLVEKGDVVRRGQLIGEHGGFISARVHAPTSGKVTAVGEAPTATGGTSLAVDIEPDGEDRWIEDITPHADWELLENRKLVSLVSDAGIAGMGGAGFPTHVKLSPPPGKTIDALLINGAECEPYLTADHRLMVERSAEIWEGIRILRKVLGCKTVRVAIEDNKPDAIAAMEAAMAGDSGDSAVLVLPTEYPQGAEKQMIFTCLGREVPSGGLPMDVGALVENVGTTLAVYEAVVKGVPLTQRVTTVTGLPVTKPGNVLARIGTRYGDLLTFCGGLRSASAKVISGGPMMGFAQHGLDVATTKTTSGLLLLRPEQVHSFSSMPCIGCGRCVQACPMALMPSELSQMIEAEDVDAAEGLNVMDCIECGCCAFECPAHRPLVQHMKQAKARIMIKRREQKPKEK